MTSSKVYQTWNGIRHRCRTPTHKAYKDYGARGIDVIDSWYDSFDAFVDCVGYPPPGAQMDRIDNEGNYEPGNVRWVSATSNGRNKRNNRDLTAFGATRCLSEWVEKTGIPRVTISNRVARGWCVERALSVPVRGANNPSRDAHIVCLYDSGISAAKIAAQIGISVSRVFKIIKESK